MQYFVAISFKANRELTCEEIDALSGCLNAMVEEPVDEQGDDINIMISNVNISFRSSLDGIQGI